MAGALLGAPILAFGGELTFADFPANVSDLGAATTTYRAELEHEADGELRSRLQVGSNADYGDWIDPPGSQSGNEAYKRDYVSGNNSSYTAGTPANNTYQDISVDRFCGIEHTTSGGSDDITTTLNMYLAEDTGGTGEIGPQSVVFTAGELF